MIVIIYRQEHTSSCGRRNCECRDHVTTSDFEMFSAGTIEDVVEQLASRIDSNRDAERSILVVENWEQLQVAADRAWYPPAKLQYAISTRPPRPK
jgi:hypothetical protein